MLILKEAGWISKYRMERKAPLYAGSCMYACISLKPAGEHLCVVSLGLISLEVTSLQTTLGCMSRA